MIAFAQATNFKAPPLPQLVEIVNKPHLGHTHTLVCEKANKRLKETVLRESTSNVLSGVRAWEELQSSKLLEKMGRQELTTSSHASAPPFSEFSKLFGPTVAIESATPTEAQAKEKVKRLAEKEKIAKVKTDKFVTFTPASEQEIVAEGFLMQTMLENKCWYRAADAFHAGLLPKHTVVRDTSTKESFWVENSYKVAAMLWPVKQVKLSLWAKDLTVSCVIFACEFDISHWECIPTRYCSPMQLIIEDLGKSVYSFPLICFSKRRKRYVFCVFSLGPFHFTNYVWGLGGVTEEYLASWLLSYRWKVFVWGHMLV
jgi:hypothetical protein